MTFRGEYYNLIERFKQRLLLPLVKCWLCGCSNRIINETGLCYLCQPTRRGKSALNQKKENDEPETVFITEINTDNITL